MNPESRIIKVALPLSCFIGGALVDFLTNGVLKIQTAVVYVPLYVVGIITLSAWLVCTRWASLNTLVIVFLFSGAFGANLFWGHRNRLFRYEMTLTSKPPMAFSSPDFPQQLIVQSAKVEQKINSLPPKTPVEAVSESETSYGCITKYRMNTVAGIDIRYDDEARWIWKFQKDAVVPNGPTREDQTYVWCHYAHLY